MEEGPPVTARDNEPLEKELRELRRQLEELRKAAPQVKKVQHRVTPIARMVQGDEVHFRLAEGKVSVVPLKELG